MMLFNLTNTPAIYQELINDTFQNILDKYVIVYLDNTLIYLNGMFKDHVIKIKEIFKQFSNRKLLFKPKKYKFY